MLYIPMLRAMVDHLGDVNFWWSTVSKIRVAFMETTVATYSRSFQANYQLTLEQQLCNKGVPWLADKKSGRPGFEANNAT
jgi:hypothetical protein